MRLSSIDYYAMRVQFIRITSYDNGRTSLCEITTDSPSSFCIIKFRFDS